MDVRLAAGAARPYPLLRENAIHRHPSLWGMGTAGQVKPRSLPGRGGEPLWENEAGSVPIVPSRGQSPMLSSFLRPTL